MPNMPIRPGRPPIGTPGMIWPRSSRLYPAKPMRTLLSVYYFTVLASAAGACQNRGEGMSQEEQPQYVPTAGEAIARAKADLAGFLRSTPDVNLGVSEATLARSQAGAAIPRMEVDFQKLLTADSTRPLGELAASQRTSVIPLLAGDSVVTVVEIRQDSQGWRVAGLGGKDIAGDLAQVSRAAGPGQHDITLYEVPNLPARVYSVKRAKSEILYTDYRGKFSLPKGVPTTALKPVPKADAIEFQRTYGEV